VPANLVPANLVPGNPVAANLMDRSRAGRPPDSQGPAVEGLVPEVFELERNAEVLFLQRRDRSL
jgi:hypothetical protein